MKQALALSLGAAALLIAAGIGLRLAPGPQPMLAIDEPVRAYREAVAQEMLAGKPSTRAIRDKLVSVADAQAMYDEEFRLMPLWDKLTPAFNPARLGGVRLDRSHPPTLHFVVLMKHPIPEDAQRLADLHLAVPARIEATPYSNVDLETIMHDLSRAMDPAFARKAGLTGMYFDAYNDQFVVESLSGEARPIQAHLRQFPQLSELPLLVKKGRYSVQK